MTCHLYVSFQGWVSEVPTGSLRGAYDVHRQAVAHVNSQAGSLSHIPTKLETQGRGIFWDSTFWRQESSWLGRPHEGMEFGV
jgi:hypothetical protein